MLPFGDKTLLLMIFELTGCFIHCAYTILLVL